MGGGAAFRRRQGGSMRRGAMKDASKGRSGMDASLLYNHLLISLGPWLGGILIGGGLGYAGAYLLRDLYASKPDVRRAATIVPWRAMVLGLLLFAWSPFIPIRLGLGTAPAMVMAGLFTVLLWLPFTVGVLMHQWFPASLEVRLLGGSRSLAMAATAAALAVGVFTGGGVGPYLMQQINLLQWGQFFRGTLTLAAIAMIVDLLLGILQFVICRDKTDSQLVQQALS